MKKKILIIDDSALMRRVISDIINSDDRFTVSDIAVNGLEGFDLITRNSNKYDAVLLDINMPKMNGLELLEQLARNHIKLVVIVVSTVAKKDAKETIRALELGAFDFVTKPISFLETKGDIFRNRLIQCLTLATNQNLPITNSVIEETKPINKVRNKEILNKSKASKLIALACSTGGPKALQTVIPELPANMDAAMLVVQHMPEGFTKTLAARLNELSKVTVKEAENGDIIQKGVVYIAKGGYQMRLLPQASGEYKLSITLEAARNGLKPCADIMYESLLDSTFDEITCVVLTGMGSDGTKGIKQLDQKKRIYVIAQNEATSTVYGMPKVIKESGLVDEVVSLSEVADAITRNVGVH
ncbi:two-component system chemotaxis response regulator CheB [Mobilisporobacter senegalensis]|uniref:Protein-glutamate methylesterase/protein-glutamine glutaminase n=1 Tax=Mobilisporobacter senegalensis TaxID=1329262 RepID=A0A3N1Y0L2_9FIRM|nr:chemotaxis-specific protein-glutamate methyltransferase CheB [Mobilisporobacter senegalensis]ROR30787.1 two-component system chemotaxis response regulator CheB [Mobilisporobacter senegalensis]